MTRIQHLVHAIVAEVDDMAKVMTKSHKEMNGPITAVAVDNTANTVVNQGCKKYEETFPDEPGILKICDCAHCLDLLAKDSMKVTCFESLLADVSLLMKFSCVRAIDGSRSEFGRTGQLPESHRTIRTHSESQFKKVGMTFLLKNSNYLL